MKRRIVQLVCDGCGTLRAGKPGGSLDDLREALATVGWRSNKALDRDACPTCLEADRA